MQYRAINAAPIAALFVLLAALTLNSTPPPKGLPVYLPDSVCDCADDRRTIVISILEDGSIKLNEEDETLTTLESRLREVFSTRAERVLFVKADPGLTFQKVAQIIDIALRQADYVALWTPTVENRLRKNPCCGPFINVPRR